MVKEMEIIASQEEPYQQQHASNVCNHDWIFTYKNNNLSLNIIFQVFSCRKENKLEFIQHIKHNDKEEKGWFQSLWVIVNISL